MIQNIIIYNERIFKADKLALACVLEFIWLKYGVMRSPYFSVLIFNKLETILKINKKYFEKSLQLSKIRSIFVSSN